MMGRKDFSKIAAPLILMLNELINRIIQKPDFNNGCEDDEVDGDGGGGGIIENWLSPNLPS